ALAQHGAGDTVSVAQQLGTLLRGREDMVIVPGRALERLGEIGVDHITNNHAKASPSVWQGADHAQIARLACDDEQELTTLLLIKPEERSEDTALRAADRSSDRAVLRTHDPAATEPPEKIFELVNGNPSGERRIATRQQHRSILADD